VLRRWWAACWRALLDTVWTRTATLERQVAALQAQVAALEALTVGIERVTSVDGVPGWYFAGRVGVLTKYFLVEKTGRGAALSCATSWDRYAFHAVNEAGAEVAERVAIGAQSLTRTEGGCNVAVRALAAHCDQGNFAIHAQAGLSMRTDDKLTIIKSDRYQ
jgi:hypothetical protein